MRNTHVPLDRLAALALVAHAPADAGLDAPTVRALDHLEECPQCAAELARLTADADELRAAAFAEADAVFDEAMLDAQRTRVLDRLAAAGQVARVIRFPARRREAVLPVSHGNRRWISVAAAAGLIIGLVAGQMVHFVPAWDTIAHRQETIQAPRPAFVNAASTSQLSDDELLAEIEDVLSVRAPATVFRTLDRLTPLEDYRGQ